VFLWGSFTDQTAQVVKYHRHFAVGIDAGQYTSSPVKVCHWEAFLSILVHPMRENIVCIIGTSFKFAAAIRTGINRMLDMSTQADHLAAIRAGKPSLHPGANRLLSGIKKK
jgi:hypothetical protein